MDIMGYKHYDAHGVRKTMELMVKKPFLANGVGNTM